MTLRQRSPRDGEHRLSNDRRLGQTARRCIAGFGLSVCAVALASTPASATENGLNAYPTGVNTVLPGLLPPPGKTEFYNYDEYYSVSQFVDSSGKSEVPGFRLSVSATVIRLIHTYKFSLGQFHISSGIVQPVLNVSLQAAGHSQRRTALGDTTLNPIDIGYASADHKLFAWAGADVFVPTGQYNDRNLSNTGVNYLTYMPELAATWFPSRDLQVSFQATQENHSTNPANGYHSGSSYGVDYSLDYAPFKRAPKLHTSFQGYVFEQFSNDTIHGRAFNGGNLGETIAIGPEVRYDLHGGGIAIKYQHELSVKNRPHGDRYWLQLALPL